MTEPRTPTGHAQHDLAWDIVGEEGDEEGNTFALIGGHQHDRAGCAACATITTIETEALPSVERLARAVPERLPTGNPEVDRLRAAWNEGRGAVLAALRSQPEAER